MFISFDNTLLYYRAMSILGSRRNLSISCKSSEGREFLPQHARINKYSMDLVGVLELTVLLMMFQIFPIGMNFQIVVPLEEINGVSRIY